MGQEQGKGGTWRNVPNKPARVGNGRKGGGSQITNLYIFTKWTGIIKNGLDIKIAQFYYNFNGIRPAQ